jgi:EAL domain-containing protein (putative c-di-GMP-specific phosphodiesterase class I)
VAIGEWVIQSALAQMQAWQAAGLQLPVSVNVGARQLQQSGFVTRLRELLAQQPGVAAAGLELEVLETSALEDVAKVSLVMQACRDMGVRFSLDDFGTGYSSLTYLKRLPVSQLKIDQSFVRDMLDDPDDLAILEGVLGLATAFGREVIAEGVETVAHGSLLLQLGCELAQGYGIARPMPAQDLPAWALAWRPDPAWVDLPAISRDDLPLLFARVEHRAWISAIGKYLRGAGPIPVALDLLQCRFGRWLAIQGSARADCAALDTAHRAAHGLANELLAWHARGETAQALAKWPVLLALQDRFLDLLQQLVRAQR